MKRFEMNYRDCRIQGKKGSSADRNTVLDNFCGKTQQRAIKQSITAKSCRQKKFLKLFKILSQKGFVNIEHQISLWR
jgi:hypothetical protein